MLGSMGVVRLLREIRSARNERIRGHSGCGETVQVIGIDERSRCRNGHAILVDGLFGGVESDADVGENLIGGLEFDEGRFYAEAAVNRETNKMRVDE